MSLATQYAAANDATFQSLIQAAIIQSAVAIMNELVSVAYHSIRATLANNVLLTPSAYVATFAQAVASQAIDKTATDAVILTTVASVWNAIAGVLTQ
jgi:hypothetical protein